MLGAWIATGAVFHPAAPPLATAGAQDITNGGTVLMLSGGQSCAGCHAFTSGLSHPVDIRPKAGMTIPATLPLHGGRVTCTTCHADARGNAHSLAMDTHDPMLRGTARGAAFCGQCHQDQQPGKQSHAQALAVAHLQTAVQSDFNAGRGTSRTATGTSMDGITSLCLSCHDGATGQAKSLGNSHPVGIRYDNPARDFRRAVRRMVPQSAVDPRVRLFDGTVGCASCHEPFSDGKMLVMANDQGQLCTSCHDLR
ncbi:MAG: cytochrome c3 family protein [Phycisphaeraceae bacterium]